MSDSARWRLRYLAREASLNTFARGGRAFIGLVLAVLAGSGAAAFASFEVQNFNAALEALGAEGRNVLVISSSDAQTPARIDRLSCEAIAGQDGVQRAGVLESTGRFDVLPLGVAIPIFSVSTTLLPELSNDDGVVGSALTDVAPGTPLPLLVDGASLHAVTGREQPRGIDVNSGISIAAPPTDAFSVNCVVVLDRRANLGEAAPVVMAQLRSEGPALAAVPALMETSDLRAAYESRPSRFLPIVIGALLGGTLGLINLSRAAEFAVYRFSGTSRLAFLGLIALELSLIGAMAALGYVVCAALLSGLGSDFSAGSVRGIGLGAAIVATALMISAPLAFRSVADLAKDR